MKAGITIEAWKLDIFTRHLTQAGYKFENKGKLVGDTLLLSVETPNAEALAIVLAAAMKEARRTGAPNA